MGTRTTYEPGTFSWADLATTDTEAAKAFYSAFFGWELSDSVIPEEMGGGTYTMASVDGEDVAAVAAMPPGQEGAPPHWNSYVTVASADDAVAKAQELGAQSFGPAFDVMQAGRMAALGDPTGAPFLVWERRDHIGAGRVNEPGCLTWNDLATRDPETAMTFYGDLFGWTFEGMETGGGPRYWVIGHDGAANGRNGGIREMVPEEEGVPPHWMPYFAVESAQAAVDKAVELGGTMAVPPTEVPSGVFAAIGDPQGAYFSVSQAEFDD
jgi:hypothetical protein